MKSGRYYFFGLTRPGLDPGVSGLRITIVLSPVRREQDFMFKALKV